MLGPQYVSILFFGAPALIVLAQWSKAIAPKSEPSRSYASPSSSSQSAWFYDRQRPHLFGLPPRGFLRSWKQARTPTLTCCIATEPIEHPIFLDLSPACAHARDHHRTRQGLSAVARVVSDGLWYRSVQQPSSASRARGGTSRHHRDTD